jgi:excisionase family DNA binding protein
VTPAQETLIRALAAGNRIDMAARRAGLTEIEARRFLLNEVVGEKEADTNEPLLVASDIARFCQVDLKTVHNWVDKGSIPFFRTPGRHLRFNPESVRTFLKTYGYPIPPELRRKP